jgi:YbbR domain-containing protein
MLFDNVALKFLSLVLALTVFLLVNTERDRQITERVAVSYAMPGGDKVLVGHRVDDVRVTIKGTPRRLRKMPRLDPINLDLRNAPSGDIPITDDMIKLPAGLEVVDVNPRTVPVTWDERAEKTVEIAPLITGKPQHGYVMTEIKPAPATVQVRGAKGTLATLHSISTRAVSVENRAESFTAETEAIPPDGVDLAAPTPIIAHVSIDEELVTRKLAAVAVVVRGDADAAKWQITPAQVDISLTGALLAVEKVRLIPVVKVVPGDVKPREAEVSIEGVPPGIGVKISPERVQVAPAHPSP